MSEVRTCIINYQIVLRFTDKTLEQAKGNQTTWQETLMQETPHMSQG